MSEAAKIAEGLTEVMRFYVVEGPHPHWTLTRRALAKRGLVDADGRLTPLGLAVRNHLNGGGHE